MKHTSIHKVHTYICLRNMSQRIQPENVFIFLLTRYILMYTNIFSAISISKKYLRVFTNRKTLIFLSTKYLRVYTNKSVIFLSTKYLHLENLDISKWLHKWKMKTDFVSNNREFVTKSTSVLTSYCHALFLTEYLYTTRSYVYDLLGIAYRKSLQILVKIFTIFILISL